MSACDISEVFISPQGEGLYVGLMQVFIRLSGCVFDCPYCDTDISAPEGFPVGNLFLSNPVTPENLASAVLESYGPGEYFHSYSFTGGEPLLNAGFVEECGILLKKRSRAGLFLETSGLVPLELKRFDGLFDIISADIKSHSEKVLSGLPILLRELASLKSASWYLKLLLSSEGDAGILTWAADCLKEFGVNKIVIQPVDNMITEKKAAFAFEIFYKKGIEARLIPQTHKILGLK